MSNKVKLKPVDTGRTVVTDIDAVVAEAAFEPYVFTLKGRERELPHLRMLTLPQVRKLDGGAFEDVLHDVAAEVADDLLALPAHALDVVVESWLAHGGVDMGELLASASS